MIQDRADIFVASVTFYILQQFGGVNVIVERDVVEFEFAAHITQRRRILFFDDVLRQVNDFEHALERNHAGRKFDGRARETLKRAVELTEIRTERNDGADSERAPIDVLPDQDFSIEGLYCGLVRPSR